VKPGDRIALALGALSRALEESGRPGMVIGGLAAIAHGVARITRDVDATVVGEGTDLDVLLATFSRHAIVPRVEGAHAFARTSQVLLLKHEPSAVDIDVSLAWLPFEAEAISRATVVSVGGIPVRLPRPEDLVVYKIVAWRPQDRLDVERLVALHGDRMDLDRVRRLAAEIAAALDDEDRLADVEHVIERASGR
jgi:hypothetical protein